MKYFNIISSFFLKLFGEKKLVKSVKVLPLSIKSINPIQKYTLITESYACILKVFVTTHQEQLYIPHPLFCLADYL